MMENGNINIIGQFDIEENKFKQDGDGNGGNVVADGTEDGVKTGKIKEQGKAKEWNGGINFGQLNGFFQPPIYILKFKGIRDKN